MARMKLHLFIFHHKFVKMKRFFTILALKQPNSEKRIFANIQIYLYKYTRRLLKGTLLPKFLRIIFRYDFFTNSLLPLKS